MTARFANVFFATYTTPTLSRCPWDCPAHRAGPPWFEPAEFHAQERQNLVRGRPAIRFLHESVPMPAPRLVDATIADAGAWPVMIHRPSVPPITAARSTSVS